MAEEKLRLEETLNLEELLVELRKRVITDKDSSFKWADLLKYVEDLSGAVVILIDKDLNLTINSTVKELELQAGILNAAARVISNIDIMDIEEDDGIQD